MPLFKRSLNDFTNVMEKKMQLKRLFKPETSHLCLLKLFLHMVLHQVVDR